MNNKSIISRFPFFYGYVIIAGGTIGVLLSAPGQTVGISVFTDFLIRDLGISRESLSFAYLVGTMLSSFLLTYAGRFYDKFGARTTAMLAGFFLGLALIYMSFLTQITHYFKLLFNSAYNEILVFILISIGFFFVRFFGQGTLTMASKNMVMKWFERKRGMASAVMGIAISFGFSYSPKIFDDMIVNFGWQQTWQIIGIFITTIFVLFAYITFRDNPAQFGLVPDGTKFANKKSKSVKFKPSNDFTLAQARSTFNFWVFNLTLSLQALYITALTFNIVDIFTKADLSREDAILIFLPISVIAVVFQLLGGYLADFIRLKYLLMVQLSGMLLSMLALVFLSGGLPLYLIMLGIGIASGLFGVVSTVCWPRFYGTKYLGEISGYSMSWVVAGSAIGPYLFSLLLESSGNYSLSGIIMAIICITLLIFSFMIKNKNLSSETE